MICIKRQKGRIALELQVVEMGDDRCFVLTGGQAHLGAVTAGSRAVGFETIRFGTHKEHIVTEHLKDLISDRLNGIFSICCGIHYDTITKDEIDTVLQLSETLIDLYFDK